jgi:hypothetical protein
MLAPNTFEEMLLNAQKMSELLMLKLGQIRRPPPVKETNWPDHHEKRYRTCLSGSFIFQTSVP